MNEIKIRKASKSQADIDCLIKLRLDFICENKGADLKSEEICKITTELSKYFPKHLNKIPEEEDFIAVLAETDGKIVGTAFIIIVEKPANFRYVTGKTAEILNVFTYSEYRRQGIATNLLNFLIDEAKKANVSYIELSSSQMGKPVYEKLGFTQHIQNVYTEMRLKLI